MEIWQEALGQSLRLPGSVVTIGNFDGLHLGHQALIQKAVEWAEKCSVPAVVMTFKPHPLKVLRSESHFQTMSTVEDLGYLLGPFDVDYLWVRHFTKELAARSPEQFLQEDLKDALRPRAIVVGADFRFGAQHRGDIALLKEFADREGMVVEVIEPITHDGHKISSRRLRPMIEAGDIEGANELLGHPHVISGEVITGHQRGRGVGIPTVNLKPDTELLPASGVYVTELVIDSKVYPAVTNVGVNPTFSPAERKIQVETHALDIKLPDLYGQRTFLRFLKYLRPEKKFSGVQELVAQIHLDIEQAKSYFKLVK